MNKSTNTIEKYSWGLARQGILMVCILLASELTFIGILGYLLAQAEASATRQELAREVTSKSGSMLLTVYGIESDIGQFDLAIEHGKPMRLKFSTDEMPATIIWLRRALKENPQAEALLDTVDKNFSLCLPLINSPEAQAAVITNGSDADKWKRKRYKVRPKVNDMVTAINKLISIGEKMESQGPALERQTRQFTKKVLFIGLLVNILVVVLIAYIFFFKRIVARLDVLTDNFARLRDGRMLNPLIQGKDEIASLDAVFHDTAAVLRKEMKVLKASEERIRALIENLPVGIVMLDGNGTMELVNSAIEAEFKYSTYQLLGKRLAKLFVPGQAVVDGAPFSEQSAEAFGHNIELTALARAGHEFPVDFMMAKIEMEGESKTLAMILDASQKYKVKKMREAFVGMVRSELKEPLVKVDSFLTKLEAGSLGAISPKGVSTTKSMQQNIERLIVLLNDLFDLDKLESGKIEIDPEPTQLNTIFERSVNAVAMFAQKHRVQLQVASCQIEIFADPNRIVQVLVNLLSNAIKFSPGGSVVNVAIRQYPDRVEIGVIDTGRGIPKSHMESIFEAYRQVEAGDAQKKGGTGLGLAICKAIIDAHGGQIGVNSQEGQGSVFWFSLPIAAPLRAEVL